MKNSRLILVAFFILFAGMGLIFINSRNSKSSPNQNINPSPTIGVPMSTQPPQQIQNSIVNTTVPTQETSQNLPGNTCREGDTIRQNVKNCSDNPICDKLGTYNDRFCRMPDGTCKFFCDGK